MTPTLAPERTGAHHRSGDRVRGRTPGRGPGPRAFELRVLPLGDAELGIELAWVAADGTPQTVVSLWGPTLTAVSGDVARALKAAGYRATDLHRRRTEPFGLPEAVGTRLALLCLAVKPLSKPRRIFEVIDAVRAMTDEEVYYWYAKCTSPWAAARAQGAFRDLVSAR